MTTDEKREKIFLAVLDFADAYSWKDEDGKKRLANSEALFQSDGMQVDGLNLVGELLDILNDESFL